MEMDFVSAKYKIQMAPRPLLGFIVCTLPPLQWQFYSTIRLNAQYSWTTTIRNTQIR